MPLSAESTTVTTTAHTTATAPNTIRPAVPSAAPATTSRTAGNIATKPMRPRPPWPITFSPQVRLNRSFERLSAAPTPRSSITRIGMVRNVTRFQAMPTRPATIWPMIP